MRYSAQLDGIRGLAILAVLAYHGTPHAPGGWLGVDVFFVLSGYLITRLLIAEQDTCGRVDFRAFYIRRALRLGPALLVALLLAIPIMLAFPHRELGWPWPVADLGVLGYVGNWLNVMHPVSLGPLTHTWSLAIEEQFYLLWPAVLVFLLRRGGARRVIRFCVGAIIVVVIGRALLLLLVAPDHLWFATTSRADALLVGALVAALGRREQVGRGWSAAVSFAAVALGVLSLIHTEFSRVMLLGGLTVVAGLAAVLIAGADAPVVSAVLGWAPLRTLGRVSYGIYLYHYPVFFLAYALPLSGMEQWAVKITGTGALVTGSWFLVERPALKLKRRFERRPATLTTAPDGALT